MKLASEAAISAALESFLQRVWIFRFPNVVGSRATHGAIYDFAQKLKKNPTELEVLGDGSQEKPYFHVADLVDAMLFIVSHAEERLNYFNIGTADNVTSVRYLAEAVVKRMAPGAKIKYGTGNRGWVGDVPRFNYSIEKLKKLDGSHDSRRTRLSIGRWLRSWPRRRKASDRSNLKAQGEIRGRANRIFHTFRG
jgi:UDP-glucose 4-epimerase